MREYKNIYLYIIPKVFKFSILPEKIKTGRNSYISESRQEKQNILLILEIYHFLIVYKKKSEANAKPLNRLDYIHSLNSQPTIY